MARKLLLLLQIQIDIRSRHNGDQKIETHFQRHRRHIADHTHGQPNTDEETPSDRNEPQHLSFVIEVSHETLSAYVPIRSSAFGPGLAHILPSTKHFGLGCGYYANEEYEWRTKNERR